MPSGLLLILLPCALLLTNHCIEAQDYRIVQERFGMNTVTLTCGRTGGQAFPSTDTAQFWLNDTNTRHYEADRGQPTWRFEVNRDIEGEYYCGPNQNQISDKVQVICKICGVFILAVFIAHICNTIQCFIE